MDDLGNQAVLDVGCGTKLAKVLIEEQRPISRYAGVDVNPEVIAFLNDHVSDSRFSWHHIDVYNELYNPRGIKLCELPTLPVGQAGFDIICLFSVFTHLAPDDFRAMLYLLRRYIKPDGLLVFSLYIRDMPGLIREAILEGDPHLVRSILEKISAMLMRTSEALNTLEPVTGKKFQDEFQQTTGYTLDALLKAPMQLLRELVIESDPRVFARMNRLVQQVHPEEAAGCRDVYPEAPLLHIIYDRWRALELIDGTGWEVVSLNPREQYIQHYFVCLPAV